MKQFLYHLSNWWFAMMAPINAPLTTIKAREDQRKRQLFSVIVSITTLLQVPFILMDIFIRGTGEIALIGNVSSFAFLLLTLRINQRGYLTYASLVYLVTSFLAIAILIYNLSLTFPFLIFSLWAAFLILLVTAGLFLPAWGPLLLAVLENTFMGWFLLIERWNQLSAYTGQAQGALDFFSFTCIIISVVSIFSAISTATTTKAIIRADRAVELEQAHQKLSEAYTMIQKQALTDALTGLPNHRAVMNQFSKELERAQRYKRPLSVLFFDADRFKKVNDTHGHATGDAVLREISERASRALRGGDTLGRFGGEEFVILLPEAESQEASIIAERIRTIVADGPVATSEVEGGIFVTVSIGLATFPQNGDSEQELLTQADEAMYIAKKLGRNQVRTAEEAHQIGADVELVLLMTQESQLELAQREGVMPEQLRETYTLKLVCLILSLLEHRDESLSAHAYAVSDLATILAQKMGLQQNEVSKIGMAALLHDIGKIAVPDSLLVKGDSLSNQERAILQNHAELGAQILEVSPFLTDLIPAVRHHHERWDGNGFPDQLAEEAIPLASRIIAVAEAYDSVLRVYPDQAKYTEEEAFAKLEHNAGTQFDPAVVQALREVLPVHQELQTIAKRTRLLV